MFSPVARIVFVVGLRTLASIVLAQQPAEVVLTTACSASGLVGYDYKAVSADFNVGWLAIGFSSDGNMIGSDAVVGSVEGVLEYYLGSKGLPVQPPLSPLEASIRPFSVDEQEITGAVLKKDENVTSLSFTRPSTPEVAGKQALLAGADTSAILLWAAGSDDSFGYHFLGRGAFNSDLACTEDQPVVEGDVVEEDAVEGDEQSGTEVGRAVPLLTEGPSTSPFTMFSVSPSFAPAPPFTAQPADGSTTSGALPRVPTAVVGFVCRFAGVAALGFAAVEVFFAFAVL
ncbi:conserved unknown protein [Ectocarpus siliculosus]|uniref:DOMON domain-containing protein n=1 Tax=Ectocarpus siliculosus TaxID=2880 RepID=D8LHP6_ECTSI|nr:conserved unknown protein [Ectocarpus siliculosus]|eukprot:CBN79328.1 conserved unknown protein [Ectocarpus siliculosus]